jgi:hypothetical protein
MCLVVYHHGMLAAGGHYTCDVRRQNGDWIRMDDTSIWSISESDACEIHSTSPFSDDPHSQDYGIYYMNDEDDAQQGGNDSEWQTVSSGGGSGKGKGKRGAAAASRPPPPPRRSSDGKWGHRGRGSPYLLFYVQSTLLPKPSSSSSSSSSRQTGPSSRK